MGGSTKWVINVLVLTDSTALLESAQVCSALPSNDGFERNRCTGLDKERKRPEEAVTCSKITVQGFKCRSVSHVNLHTCCHESGCPSILLTLAPHRVFLHGLHFPLPIALITQLSPITRSPESYYTHTIQKTFISFHISRTIV